MAAIVPYGTEPDVEHARTRQEAFAYWMTKPGKPAVRQVLRQPGLELLLQPGDHRAG